MGQQHAHTNIRVHTNITHTFTNKEGLIHAKRETKHTHKTHIHRERRKMNTTYTITYRIHTGREKEGKPHALMG